MAKHRETKLNSEPVVVTSLWDTSKFPIEDLKDLERVEGLENSNPDEYTLVGLRLIYPAKVVYDGPVTGKHYEWAMAGSVTMVAEPDLAPLLAKTIGGPGCCGGNANGNRLFELA